jgi:hypothetical protein
MWRDVRFGSKADIAECEYDAALCQKQTSACLFDHLVAAQTDG